MSINDEIKQLLESSKTTETTVEPTVDSTDEVVEEITDITEELTDEQIIEEILALDELSKKTLGSYINKAANSAALSYGKHKELEAAADEVHRFTNRHMKNKFKEQDRIKDALGASMKDVEAHRTKAVKRIDGIAKATSRLTKEQKELIGSILEELETEVTMTVDVSEDVNALLNGEELSEEFKTKAATIFEAAVVTRVKDEVTKLEESYATKLSEEVAQIKEGIADKVDGYLSLVVEQWMSDNEIALTQGIKSEIMENFLSGIKSVFEQNYIEIPEEKFDVLESMESKIAELENKLNEATEKNVELHTEVSSMRKDIAISEACEGLTDTQVDKFISLVEELSFEDEETFTEKLKTIRENYFVKPSTKKQLRETFITDEAIEEPEVKKIVDPAMNAYLNAIDRQSKF